MTPPRIVIGVPTYSGDVDVHLAASLIHATQLLAARGIGFTLMPVIGYPIPVARSSLAGSTLDCGASHLLMADADMTWEPDAVVRLLAHGKDMVGVCALSRQSEAFGVLNPRPVAGAPALLEVDAVGTGLILLSRRWCQRMLEVHRAGPFEFEQVPDGFVGEDTVACRRWRALGGRIYADRTIRIAHFDRRPLSRTWDEEAPNMIDGPSPGDGWEEPRVSLAGNARQRGGQRAPT